MRRRREGPGEARDGRRDDSSGRRGSRVGRRRGVGRGLGSPVSRRIRLPSGPKRRCSGERGRLSWLVLVGRCSSLRRGDAESSEVSNSDRETSVERRGDSVALASSSRSRADSRPLADGSSSRLGAQPARERLPRESSSVSENPSAVNVVPRLLDLEPEPVSARGDGGRGRERWDRGPRSKICLDLLLSGVSLLVSGRELLRRLLDSLSLVGHLDLSLSLRVRLVEGSLVEGS